MNGDDDVDAHDDGVYYESDGGDGHDGHDGQSDAGYVHGPRADSDCDDDGVDDDYYY